VFVVASRRVKAARARRTPKASLLPRHADSMPPCKPRQPQRFPGRARKHASETTRKHGTAFNNSRNHDTTGHKRFLTPLFPPFDNASALLGIISGQAGSQRLGFLAACALKVVRTAPQRIRLYGKCSGGAIEYHECRDFFAAGLGTAKPKAKSSLGSPYGSRQINGTLGAFFFSPVYGALTAEGGYRPGLLGLGARQSPFPSWPCL